MFDLTGKTALVFGVASESSLAWGIARALADAGAKIVLGYQFKFKSRVMQLIADAPFVEHAMPCDVTDEDQVRGFFAELPTKADVLIHAIAWADPATFRKPVMMASAQEFGQALEVSAYSLLRLTRYALPTLNDGASIVSLSYLGAARVVPSYQIMGIAKAALEAITREIAAVAGPRGIRANAISAGPVKTLAASAIPGFDHILDHVQASAPLRCNIEQADVAGAALFLASDASRRITGQTLYVDAGYSIVGVPPH